MPLKENILAKDLKRTLDRIEDKSKKDPSGMKDKVNLEVGKGWAKDIDKYIREADVKGNHEILALMIQPGTQTMGEIVGLAVLPGVIITPGQPVPMSTKGPFGKGAYPGATGKIK